MIRDEEENKINKLKVRKKKPPTRYRSTKDYDFLQYIRVVYKWAMENHPELTRGELEMILFLYPMGVFKRASFNKFKRVISMNKELSIASLMKRGYLVQFRPPNKHKRQAGLFALSHKAKKMCNYMHKVLVGEAVLSKDRDKNKLATKSKRINSYYMDVIEDMNKENKEIMKERSN